MRSAAFFLLLASAGALALVAAQPSWAWPQPRVTITYHTAAPLVLHTISNASSGASPTRAVACGLIAGCALGRVVSISPAAWTDSHVPHPTLAAEAVVPWAALPAGAPTLSGIRQRLAAEAGAVQTWLKQAADRTAELAEQAPAAGAAWVLARHTQAGHGCAAASAAVADAAAAVLKQTRARLQRGLAAAATALDTARALVTAKTRQLAGAAAAALGRARAAAADAAALLHGRSWRVADAAAAALKQTRARLQRGLAAAATAVDTARALVAAKTRQLAGAAATALGRARAAAVDAAALLHGRSWRVADAAAAALKQTRATLQRGLAVAATAVVRTRALIAPTTRQLAGAAATALGHAWPASRVYPLHATADLLVRAAATAGDAAAWARPAAQTAAAQCRERALLAALRGRRQAVRATGSLPPPAGLLCSGMARCALLLAVHGMVCAVTYCSSQCCCLCVLSLLPNQACRLSPSSPREGYGL
jgi:hypothetical protein